MKVIATRPTTRAPAQQISRVPYLPGLDGMRAVAVLAVMVYHAHLWLTAGFLGVEVFFVISGYLITLLLIAEHERVGRIHLGQFWHRRFRRLLPALYVALLMVAMYCLIAKTDALGKLRGDLIGALTYSTNWYQIFSGQSYTGEFDFVPLRHLWSLAVEEQFYLIWPLVMLVILRKGRARLPRVGLWLFGISIVITVATAVFFHPGSLPDCTIAVHGHDALGAPCTFEVFGRAVEKNNFLYLGTISRMSGILLGAGFAMLWRPIAIMRGPLRHRARLLDLLGVLGLTVFGALAYRYELFSSFTQSWYAPIFRGGFLLTGLATLLIIAAVTHSGTLLSKVLGNPVLNYVGTRSYGLYLFHWPIYEFIRKEAGVQLSVKQLLIAWAITGVVAETSYRFVESPIRKGRLSAWWRHRRGLGMVQRQRLLAGLACGSLLLGFVGVRIALAPVKCTNVNECSFEAGSKATKPSTPTTPTSHESTAVPTTGVPQSTLPGESTTTTEPATTTTAAPVKYVVYAIGDSVMLGARPMMLSAGIDYVDAAVSRQAKTGADILEAVSAAGQLGDYVVIHLGTNGPMSAATLDRLMAATASAKVVVVLTVSAARDWTNANNALIRALPATHPNVVLVDWQMLAGAHPDYITKDGVHLKSAEAKKFYTNLVLGGLGFAQLP
jgi:peptidoglycan/LPS O-acetylase OafA/YrhL